MLMNRSSYSTVNNTQHLTGDQLSAVEAWVLFYFLHGLMKFSDKFRNFELCLTSVWHCDQY